MSDQTQPTPPPQTVVNVSMANTNTAVAEATAEASGSAAPEAAAPPPPQVKSLAGAYLYWILTGYFAWHRLYLGRPRRAWLFLFWASVVVTAGVSSVGDPLVLVAPAALLALDLFSIPRWFRRYNKSVVAVREDAKVEKEQATDLRTLLLHEAHRGDGRLTVTQGVMASGTGWEHVETCLRDMVQAGYVDVDNEPNSGVIVYVFPELVGRPQVAPAEAASAEERTA